MRRILSAEDKRGFATGVAAGIAATLVLFAYRVATGVPMPQEALAEWMVQMLPYPVFAFILAQLQHLAKPAGFAMAVVIGLLGSGAGGVLYAQAARASHWPRLPLGLIVAALTWVSLTWLVLPTLSVAFASLAYGMLLVGLGDRRGRAKIRGGRLVIARASRGASKDDRGTVREPMSRRVLLRRSALAVLLAAVTSRLGTWADAAGTQAVAVTSDAAAAASGIFRRVKGMPPEVTPNRRFYQISKNYPFDPAVDVARWSLQVAGLVANPLQLSLGELLKAAPSVERYQTLECISNEVGGDLIGNARWKGIRIRDILAMAKTRPEATTIIWHSADGYLESVPLDVAMDAESLLAYEMNGEPLPQQHGAPVRVLLLNRYGTKQPKWLTGIEAANTDFSGWKHQRFSRQAVVKTNSAFSVQVRDRTVVRLGGWAFAGHRGISKVELSADKGNTWFPAALKEALGENAWQFWAVEWAPPGPGDYSLKVRAVDGMGAVQPGQWRRLPDGAEGYHEIRVRFGA